MRQLGARLSIGSRETDAIALDRWIPYDYYQHDVIRNPDLAAQAGAPPQNWTPRLNVLPADREAAAPFLEEIKQPYVIIHSGARDVRRCWPAELFASVSLANFAAGSPAIVYRYSSSNLGGIVRQADQSISGGSFSATFPGSSIIVV